MRNRQRPAGFALALLGALLCLGGASPWAFAASITTLHAFNPLYPPYHDGANPQTGLILASDGNFYGVTFSGGGAGPGTVYKMAPDGTVTVLPGSGYTFSGGYTDGANPTSLVQGSDGNFYGTTGQGGYINGSLGWGTVFKITSAGVITTLHVFNVNTDGGDPVSLVQGRDGNFYGTTFQGVGAGQYGTVFKITPSGSFTTLHAFTNGFDGGVPVGSLVQGPDGNFYGVTQQGGAYNYGTVFRITPDGTLTTLHAFTSLSPYPNYTNVDGAAPNTGLVLEGSGDLYGSTYAGGAYAKGTIFRITPSGTFTTLANYSATALTTGRNSIIYGATAPVGPQGGISIFQISPFSTLIPIARISSGNVPSITNLTQANNGQFYFTSSSLGNYGEIDRLNYSPFDITGNGQPDLLFQNPTTGQLSVTSMTGPTASSPTAISNTVPAGWKAVGIGDFNLDAQPDLLLQNPTTGQLAVWYMNGAAATGGAYISPKQAPGWQVVSVVDVNADGNPDILFQNSSTGQLAVWYMNGTVATQASYITPNPPSGWKAIGIGDFNGDGNLELLLQNPTTGQMALWFLSGTAARSAAYITPSQNPAWQAVSIVDLNGDGKADIVFQNKTTGQLAVWYMNGTSASGAAYITSSQSSGGQVVGPR